VKLRTAIVAALVIGSVLLVWSHLRPDPLAGFPRVMLWAWERPEDLRFIRPGSAGIAFLARTVWLDGERVSSKPRLQTLRFNPRTPLMAVVRIESAGRGLPPRADAMREILRAIEIPEVRVLQIDFDARASERAWYGALLRDLRRALPARMPLAITALASWCEQDGWIRDLPVTDATPMLFQMGPDEAAPRGDFDVHMCRQSVGLSMDELPAAVPHGRRLYFFNPRSWTPEAYQAAMEQARRFR
jgi:hypothetical protein